MVTSHLTHRHFERIMIYLNTILIQIRIRLQEREDLSAKLKMMQSTKENGFRDKILETDVGSRFGLMVHCMKVTGKQTKLMEMED